MRPVWDPALFAEAFCERRTPALVQLLDEPLNVATNVALFIAVALLARRAMAMRRDGATLPVPLLVLVALVGLMAVGSAAFHLTGAPAAGVLDGLAVRLFALWFAACALRWLLAWSWKRVHGVVLPALLMVLMAPTGAIGAEPLAPWTGALPLLPGVAGLVFFALMLARRDDPAWRVFALAAAAFALAVVFHRTDRPLCAALPTGTHFLWHLLSAVTAYLIVRALIDRAALHGAVGSISARCAAALSGAARVA